MRRVGIPEDTWLYNLLGLIPFETKENIACESEEKLMNYKHVKQVQIIAGKHFRNI